MRVSDRLLEIVDVPVLLPGNFSDCLVSCEPLTMEFRREFDERLVVESMERKPPTGNLIDKKRKNEAFSIRNDN